LPADTPVIRGSLRTLAQVTIATRAPMVLQITRIWQYGFRAGLSRRTGG